MADFDKAEQSERCPCEKKSDEMKFLRKEKRNGVQRFPSIIQDNENKYIRVS